MGMLKHRTPRMELPGPKAMLLVLFLGVLVIQHAAGEQIKAAGPEPSEYEALELPQNMENDDDLEDLTPDDEIDPDSEGEDEKDDSVPGRRHKRFIHSPDSLWPKGIVPFVFSETLSDRHERSAKRAMRFISDYSCIDFVPWNSTTRELYSLPSDGHLVLTSRSGSPCYCSLGKQTTSRGSTCNACTGMTTVHELGHGLGFWHEHGSIETDGWIRMDLKNITGNWDQYRRVLPANQMFYGFDISSPMIYKQSYGSSPLTYALLFPELRCCLATRVFYFFKEIAAAYKCHERVCSHVNMTCHNEGYVTRVKGKCQCMCVGRLDPETGCTTMLPSDSSRTEFPGGNYTLLAPATGCPGNSSAGAQFQTGELTHYFVAASHSTPLLVKGRYSGDTVQQHFCVRQSPDNGFSWPPGSYCILRSGGVCPSGFYIQSFIQFDNKPPTAQKQNHWSGALPDGLFGDDIRLEFCCRDDGWSDLEPLDLPNSEPFILFHTRDCYKVKGMMEHKGYIRVQHHRGDTTAVVPRDKPSMYHRRATGDIRFYYCHYQPLKSDCGGIFELNSTRRSITFTSPNYPENYDSSLECQWIFKGTENSTLVLNMNDFDIEGKDGNQDCKDELLINHARIAQAPKQYCGSVLKQSIRSITNMMMVTLRTNRDNGRRGFNATVTVALAEEHCFNPADKGVNYRGKVNRTRDLSPCVPWSDVVHCENSAFNGGDYYDGLDENYCRNPGNGLRPWCYTHAEHCTRNYCDVCQLEKPFDKYDNCDDVLARGECSDQNMAAAGCVLTCQAHLVQPETPVPYTELSCPPPRTPPDAVPLNHTQTSYPLGQEVVFQCASSAQFVSTRCLSDGTWSPVGYACGGCPMGWTSFDKMCYMPFYKSEKYWDAVGTCRSHGHAKLAMPGTKRLADFITSLRGDLNKFWIGLRLGHASTWSWRWENGTALSNPFWEQGQPKHERGSYIGGSYCAISSMLQKWREQSCTQKRPFVCHLNPTERVVCTDKRTDCAAVLGRSPAACQEQPDFAWMMCPFSCGLCSGCRDGWESHGVGCYKVPGGLATYSKATAICNNMGGIIATAKDQSDFAQFQTVATNTAAGRIFWLGADALAANMSWIWQDHTPMNFSVWSPGEPNFRHGGGEARCVVMSSKGQWRDNLCRIRRRYFCKAVPGCSVPAPTSNATVSTSSGELGTGDHVTYSCKTGFLPVSGDAVRACLPSSKLTGSDLVCSAATETWSLSSSVALTDRFHMGKRRMAYTGPSPNLLVTRSGRVHSWKFYSRTISIVTFQVYRPKPQLGDQWYELVGENTIGTSANSFVQMVIPSQSRVSVQPGDMFGIYYYGRRSTVPFENCTEYSDPGGMGVVRSKSTLEDAANHVPGAVIQFENASSCVIFSFQAVIQP